MKYVLYSLILLSICFFSSCEKDTLKETGFWSNEAYCVELASTGTITLFSISSDNYKKVVSGTYTLIPGTTEILLHTDYGWMEFETRSNGQYIKHLLWVSFYDKKREILLLEEQKAYYDSVTDRLIDRVKVNHELVKISNPFSRE